MKEFIFETCCGSADDVVRSELGGADRAELNSALFLGGLTPSLGALDIAVEKTSKIKILTMIRPRQGGFCYTDLEMKTMIKDARDMIAHGSSGLVFGFLKENGTVDSARCKELLAIAGDKEAVFHRAFDVVPDWREAMEILIDIGFTRILTSGQRSKAIDGKETIREMIEYAAGRIEILPGAGLNEKNALEMIRHTGCTQLHMSKRKKCQDLSVTNNPEICFGNPSAPEEYTFDMMDEVELKRVIGEIRAAVARDLQYLF